MKKGFNLKGGVLIIGSLYWQDHLKKIGDDKRKSWRNNHLEMGAVLNVKAPIKYRRFSSDKSYTMVFDNSLEGKNFGTAKLVPFKRILKGFEDIKREVEALSHAEGRHDSDFIKGTKGKSIAWCVCGILFNPGIVNDELKSSILAGWSKELEKNETGYNTFIEDPSIYSMSVEGEFQIPWPKEITDLDFLVATSTRPKLREGVSSLTAEEIAKHVKNREYFYPNIEHGITTYQDDEIKNFLM